MAFGTAVRLGLVPRNITEYVTPPRMMRHEMQVLMPEQVRMLLGAARGNKLEALYVLALSTGMRQGELLALHWRDVDLDHRHLQVRWTVQRTRDGFTFTEPKSTRSRRKVALTTTPLTPCVPTGNANAKSGSRSSLPGKTTTWCSPMGMVSPGKSAT